MSARGWLVVIALGVLAGSLAFNWAVRPDFSRPNYAVFTEMASSVAYESQSSTAPVPVGTALAAPFAIPRELPPLHYDASEQSARRAGTELHNPFGAGDGAALARGQKVFATFCQVCHGAGGLGDGPVVRRGVPPPPSLLATNARSLPDGRIFHVITYGQGNMASYASQVDRDDRWRAVRFIRSLQAAQAPDAQPQQAARPARAAQPPEAAR
ncbi:MAG: c-type cytochrome [Deltaproteobacteria bacterium]|nr:c-type cytochrome [Deltaproteobacteria bacterium]